MRLDMRVIPLVGLLLATPVLAAPDKADKPPATAEPPDKLEQPAEKPGDKKVQLTKEQEQAVLAAYHALAAPEPESKRIEKLPAEPMARIDVSTRIRSASFGHRTWLLVPAHARHFYVEYGRSTNTPPGLFGPFDVKPGKAATHHAPPPGPTQE